jgi:hypothetical protein
MKRTRDSIAACGALRFLGLALAALAGSMVLITLPACAQQRHRYEMDDFGVVPRPALAQVLLNMPSVQRELKLTPAQIKEKEAITQRAMEKTQQARRETKNTALFREQARKIMEEAVAAGKATFTPEQIERLDQIQLQAQGPLAFHLEADSPTAHVGPPLAERLKLSDDQARRIRSLAEQGETDISQAAGFPLALDSKDGPVTSEAIRKLVAGAEFQDAKQKAKKDARTVWETTIRQIEQVLTPEQQQAYHKLLGKPFDLLTLRFDGDSEQDNDLQLVADAFGQGGGGQRSDPNFDTSVARPAYAKEGPHPRVLFDEAHHNFHTASGRYEPFAKIMRNDGYQVIPNREKFLREVLDKGEILVIANALGAPNMGAPGAADPAFTDAECEAVRDWIERGGSLLLITDHAPMGSAAQCLAKKIGVDMSTGATGDPVNSEEGETSLVFSRQNHLLGDHPITRGRDDSERVNKVRTFTGTSLKGPEGSTAILKLADTAVDHSFDDDKTKSAAGRTQGLAFHLGRGRIVVMGEAAELSAQVIGFDQKFGMNVPGIDNRKLAMNIMHWLSGVLEPREGASKKAG